MKIALSKPINVDGKEVTELDLKLDDLTGADYAFCEREALMENANVPSIDPRLSETFQRHIAARACGVEPAVLKKLGLREYGVVVAAVRDFFLV